MDHKSWRPDLADVWIRSSIRGTGKLPANNKPGQLQKDIVGLINGEKIQWVFDKRATPEDLVRYRKVVQEQLFQEPQMTLFKEAFKKRPGVSKDISDDDFIDRLSKDTNFQKALNEFFTIAEY